ncbi:MAG: hemerythrin domain-containing protein [bacterium]|nr:hemerythrin domain-containing protein [bacterium]
MLPIDPLQSEHRMIERMLGLLSEELSTMKKLKRVNLNLLEAAVDFFRFYADRCHHGKEEFILFRKLEKKDLTPELQKIMEELVDNHVKTREWIDNLQSITRRYAKGEKGAIRELQQLLEDMTVNAPKHMEKEEKRLFAPAMQYLSQEEKDSLVRDEYELDRTLIHEKYKLIIEKLEKAPGEATQKTKIIESGR